MLHLNRAAIRTQVVDSAITERGYSRDEATAAAFESECLRAHRRELFHRRVERDDLSALAGLPHVDARRERELRRSNRGRGRIDRGAAEARERLVVRSCAATKATGAGGLHDRVDHAAA